MPGGRPRDPGRKLRTLAAVTDHVLEHGLDDLKLRTLGTALRTSPRMLLYDFGSKDELVAAILEEVRTRQAAVVTEIYQDRATSREAVRALWEWLIDPAHRGYVRLYAQIHLHAANLATTAPTVPTSRGVVEELERHTDASRSDVVVISTLLHGLALRRLGDPDPAVVDAAVEHFLSIVRT